MSLIKKCPHSEDWWFCDNCLVANYQMAAVLSRLAGLPELEGASDPQIAYAGYTRWQALEKHGSEIEDLVNNETEAAWWLDHRRVLLRGSLTGKLGAVLERWRLRKSDPLEARRQDLQEALDTARRDLFKEHRVIDAQVRGRLAPFLERIERLEQDLQQFCEALQ